MECAGRAKRRRRFPSFRDVHKLQSRSSAQRPYGVRRQSEAATALSFIPRRSQTPKPIIGATTLWTAPAERSGDGAFLHSATFTNSKADHRRDHPMDCAGRAKRRRRFPSFRDVHKLQSRSSARPPYGLRRQSEAATALSFIPRRSQTPKPIIGATTLWSAPAERSGDGAFPPSSAFTNSKADHRRDHPSQSAGSAKRPRLFL